MMKPMSTILALALSLASLQAAAQDIVFDPMEQGRTLTRQFYEGDIAAVVAAFDDQLTSALGGERGVRAFREQVVAQLGAESEVLDETVTDRGSHQVYQRVVRYERNAAPFVVVWAFDSQGRASGFAITAQQAMQPAPSRFLEYDTQADLRLPFTDEWTVFWGGRTLEQNYHAANREQRFAYDIVVVRDGSTHTGSGRSNEDYYCFGRPIVAPAGGSVVTALDGIEDNVPGEMDSPVLAGNHVVINHGNSEYSFLAHFKNGSLRVRQGDTVAQGDTLGLCGNSGRSSEPHLHYHLQNTPDLMNGEGLPAKFRNYYANDELVRRGEPVQGERVRPAEGGRD
jgi:murein DD-endopeptidase MepM/ murein hydrolase activator NlpD